MLKEGRPGRIFSYGLLVNESFECNIKYSQQIQLKVTGCPNWKNWTGRNYWKNSFIGCRFISRTSNGDLRNLQTSRKFLQLNYQIFLYFCRNLNMFIKKKLKYFTQCPPNSSDRRTGRTNMWSVQFVASNTMYTHSQTDISSVLWNDSRNRTECSMKFHKVSRTLSPAWPDRSKFHQICLVCLATFRLSEFVYSVVCCMRN